MRTGSCREAEVRLAEPRERRGALGLDGVPDYTPLCRFLRRLDEAVLEQRLSAVVQRLMTQPSPQTTVAVDAAGVAPGAISTLFVTRSKDRAPDVPWRRWLQWTVAVARDRRLILAQTARRGPPHDGTT
jgi:hypothetical protein